jgi:dTDP-4-amino-4,6-dideoxygalactose transaminase
VLFESEKALKRVEKSLQERNIFPRRYFYPSLDELDFLNANSGVMEISRDISHRILCLPFFEGLEEVECREICKIILETTS